MHHLIITARQVCCWLVVIIRQESRGRSGSDHTWSKGTTELRLVVCACVWVRYNEIDVWSEC